MGPKSNKRSPKKDKENAKDALKNDEAQTDWPEVIFKVLEIINLPTDDRENIIDVSFMQEKLQGEGEFKFFDCACGTENNPFSKWTLKVKYFNEETIMDLSSIPLLVTISKIANPTIEQGDNLLSPNRTPKIAFAQEPEVVAYCCLDMYELICDEIKVIRSKALFYPPEILSGQYIKTFANMPFIKYVLTSSKPFIENKNGGDLSGDVWPLNYVTITPEFIMHPPESVFEDDTFEVTLLLPLKEDLTKRVTFTQGYRCKFSELPPFKTRYGVSHLPGEVKFSREHTNNLLDFSDLIVPEDSYLPAHFVRNYSSLICVNQMYHFKQFPSITRYLINSRTIPVEIVSKKDSKVTKFSTELDLKMLKYVNRNKVRIGSLLTTEPVKSVVKPITPKSTKTNDTKMAKKGKQGKSHAEDISVVPGEEKQVSARYAICEDGFTSCIVFLIEVDRPLITPKENVMHLDEINITENEKFNESGMPMLDKSELSTVFKTEILKFATHPNLEAYHRSTSREMYPMNDIWASAENDLFGSSALLIANEYNFSQSLNEAELEALLRKSYVFLINKTYDVLNDQESSEVDELIKFRIQCAEECQELGYQSAKDFYIMNLRDTSSSAKCLLDYAVFNLQIGDTAKAMVCALDAVDKEPSTYDSYIIQAYVNYAKRERKECESNLQFVTKCCPKFFEAWMVLYLLHVNDSESRNFEIVKQGMDNAFTLPYIGHLHKMECIFWPVDPSSNRFVRAMSNFITWGCIGFAELALAYSVNELCPDSYKYLTHKALINYARGSYIEALQDLKPLNPICTCELKKIKRLRAHCYLNLNNHSVTTVMDVLPASFLENKVYTPRCNLMNLKLAKFFLNAGKTKIGRYYLKKCSKKAGTYACLIEMGNSSLKFRCFGNALNYFKLAHKMNPYDWFPWAQLAIIYFRSNLPEQYRICSKNARKNKITDEIISRELDKIDKTLNG